MEFGKRHDTTDAADYWRRKLVTDLLQVCDWEAMGKLLVIDFGLNCISL